MRLAACVVALAACAAPKPEPAFTWAAPTFFGADKNFGGFHTSWLADAGHLVVQPAYFGGKPAAYVISEIWQSHPDVWVQPVYGFPFSADQKRTIFGVGTDSTFYSPFWRQWKVNTMDGGFTQVADVAKLPKERGDLIICPIVPDGVTLDRSTHPFTNAPFRQPIGGGKAYASGAPVEYLDLGHNLQVANEYDGVDGTVTPIDLYVFTEPGADGGRTIRFDIPAVLGEGAADHAYARRVDVMLGSAAPFIPEQHPAVTDAGEAFRGRVAANPSCFDAATFGACEWLDSEQAIEERVSPVSIFETEVTLTATPLVLEP